MSATNLDLPVLISPEQIRRREFVTIRRGYDPDQVRDYMEQLANQVQLMQSLLREACQEAEAAIRANERPRVDPYEELARRVSGVIREADAAAEQIRTGALGDAERMTEEARTDADRIRTDAQARAEDARASAEAAVAQARAEADRTIAGLAARRGALVEQLATMQERLIAVAHDLERTIEIDGPETPAAEIEAPSPADATKADDLEATIEAPTASVAPTDAPADIPEMPSPAAEVVIDVTDGDDPQAPASSAPGGAGAEELFAELDDPAYEELWEGTQAMRLEMPDIPPLDLDWGDGEDDLDDLRD
jgi:DivIVA domain-containing protein